MKKQEFIFQGASTMPYKLHGVLWTPEHGNVHTVIQITHGMTEHIGRYENFAHELTKHGIAIAGFDLRGHGQNKGNKDIASFGNGGWKCAMEDMHIFYAVVKKQFPNAKYYMLGFSLGSFLLREYLNEYSSDLLDGAMIIGTGYQPAVILNILIRIIQGEVKKMGWDNTTKLVQNLSFGTYNKKFAPNRTSSDWLCSDEKSLDLYIADELCRADISAGLFMDLLISMKNTGNKKIYTKYRKDMPILLLSGTNDPVGDMGKGIQKVSKQMQENGLLSVEMELFDGARHDVFHENENGTTDLLIKRILTWLNQR